MRNLVFTLLALAVILGALLALSRKAPVPPADFIFINGTEPETVDPHKATGVPEWHIMIALFQGLTQHNTRTLAIEPGLAKSWEVSPDGLTYTFHLRDANWSDGAPITSGDVLYSIERVIRPETASEYSYMVWELPNAEAYTTGKLKLLAKGVKIYSDHSEGHLMHVWPEPLSVRPPPEFDTFLIDKKFPELSDEEAEAGKKSEWCGSGPWWVKCADLKGPEGGEAALEFFRHQFGVSAPDPKTVVFRLEHPVPYLLDLMTHHSWWPVPRQAIERWGNEKWILPEHIVVSGPYTLERWEVAQILQLKKNPAYYDAGSVETGRVAYLPTDNRNTAFNIYATGKGNIWSEWFPAPIVDQVKARPFFHSSPRLGNYDYRLNITRPPFDNVLVRRALSLAVDRDYLTRYVTRGGEISAWSYVPTGLPGYESPKLVRFDPEAAKKLLARAGYPEGRGFPPFEILFNRDDTHTKIAESVQSMWKRTLGITVTLHPEEWKVYLTDRRTLNYDVGRFAWIGDYVDPNTFLSNFLSGSGNNQTGWKNAGFDELLKTANRMTDPVARAAKLREAETILLEDAPTIPIYYYVNYDLYDDTKWGGIHGNLLGEFKPQEVRRLKPGEAKDPYR